MIAQTLKKLNAERDAWKELAEARENLLVAYRLGNHSLADKALIRIERAQENLAARRADLVGAKQ